MARNQSGYGQDSTRRHGTLTDQHGRKYDASIDKKSGYPVGVIQPRGWTAPFFVNQGHYKFADENSPSSFRIDYETLLAERLRAHEADAVAYKKEALDRGWDPEDPSKQAAIRQVIGPKPQPFEPIVACMQGNKWILGFSQTVDQRLLPFVKQKTDKIQKAVQSMDFSDEPEGVSGILEDREPDEVDDLDELLNLEEAADPEATGGKRVAVKSTKKTRVPA